MAIFYKLPESQLFLIRNESKLQNTKTFYIFFSIF